MVAIQIDEETAAALERESQQRGLSLSDYLRSLLKTTRPPHKRESWDEIEREIEELSVDGPSLPPDFSRADIYIDHD